MRNDRPQLCCTLDRGSGAVTVGTETDDLAAGRDPRRNLCRVFFRIEFAVAVARMAVGANHVIKPVSIGDAFAVEFERLPFVRIVDETDCAARDNLAVFHSHELRSLNIIVDDKARARKALRGGAGNAARIP